MKKFVLLSFAAALISNVAMADYYRTKVSNCDDDSMRAALDRATTENRAVITIVECEDENAVKTAVQTRAQTFDDSYVDSNNTCNTCNSCNTCGCCNPQVEAVVKRDYFVRETVQQYRPVVKYVPAGTYTRVKRVYNR